MRWRREGGELRIHEEVVAAVAQLALDETAGVARPAPRGTRVVRPRGISVRSTDGLFVSCQIDLDRRESLDPERVAEAATSHVKARLLQWLGLEPVEVSVRIRNPNPRKHGDSPTSVRAHSS